MRTSRFIVSGSINVRGRAIRDVDGDIIGYRQPDGSIVRLSICLEVENKKGDEFRHVVTNQQMSDIGFSIDKYDRSDFF